jgi:hypothetical protein
MDLDAMMNHFRVASRELFNQFFRIPDPYNNDGWAYEERFSRVQAELFRALVVEPAKLPETQYGQLIPNIRVELRCSDRAPIMFNRDVDSGYWDHPLKEVTRDAKPSFVSFFDWDQLDYRNNRYVRAKVEAWPAQKAAEGKHALIEAQYVRFAKA